MHAACVMRRTFDPRELASLQGADNRVVADRVQRVKNEGDVRPVQLLRASGAPFRMSPSQLRATSTYPMPNATAHASGAR